MRKTKTEIYLKEVVKIAENAVTTDCGFEVEGYILTSLCNELDIRCEKRIITQAKRLANKQIKFYNDAIKMNIKVERSKQWIKIYKKSLEMMNNRYAEIEQHQKKFKEWLASSL